MKISAHKRCTENLSGNHIFRAFYQIFLIFCSVHIHISISNCMSWRFLCTRSTVMGNYKHTILINFFITDTNHSHIAKESIWVFEGPSRCLLHSMWVRKVLVQLDVCSWFRCLDGREHSCFSVLRLQFNNSIDCRVAVG